MMRTNFAIRNAWKTALARSDQVFDRWRPARRPSAARTVAALPARRSLLEQWSLVSAVLTDAQARTHRALDRHQSAAAQIDAATYALQRLREEVAPAFFFTIAQAAPSAPSPTAFRREQFRRCEPLAA